MISRNVLYNLTRPFSNHQPASACLPSDCDTCRWMAPASFTRAGDMSAVTHQPQSPEERQAAMQALLACPT